MSGVTNDGSQWNYDRIFFPLKIYCGRPTVIIAMIVSDSLIACNMNRYHFGSPVLQNDFGHLWCTTSFNFTLHWHSVFKVFKRYFSYYKFQICWYFAISDTKFFVNTNTVEVIVDHLCRSGKWQITSFKQHVPIGSVQIPHRTITTDLNPRFSEAFWWTDRPSLGSRQQRISPKDWQWFCVVWSDIDMMHIVNHTL